MIWQYLIIASLGAVSVFYIFRKVKAQLQSGSGSCADGCGKCGAAKAFDQIQKNG